MTIRLDAGSTAAAPLAYPAIRCAECHNKMHDEWSASTHARARRSPAYLEMRERSGGAGCDDCHAPLAKRLRPGDLAPDEGVTCEVCHNIKQVEVRRTGPGFVLQLGHVKYGPLCDAKDHYFHNMGCSPLHAQGELCAGCHLYYRALAGGGELPVFTEYEEWTEGPYQAKECQSCHMPETRTEVADGAGERDGVGHHGLLGEQQDLRGRALAASATVSAIGSRIRVDLVIKNVGAGHMVPTGLPERRVIARVVTVSPTGAQHATVEHGFGRILVDETGKRVPFYLATRVASDDRIPPDGSRKLRLELDAPDSGELHIDVIWQAIDAEIARQLVTVDVEEATLLRLKLAIRPLQNGRRRGLPRTMELGR
jgi:hypothetical protein